jgi:hypothetical protein
VPILKIEAKPSDYLNEIFQKYGYYDDRNVSLMLRGLKGAEVIAEVMKNLRASSPEKIIWTESC